MDQRGAGFAIPEHRDGVVVRCAGKLGATLREAPNLLTQAFPLASHYVKKWLW
jgi:hypothetical protein